MNNRAKERTFRIYVTDALKYIAENTAKKVGGTTLTARYVDIITPSKSKDERTEAEVINGIKEKLRKVK